MHLLLESLSAELSDLIKMKAYIAKVTDADHFYTDGLSVGATWRIGLPDSDLNFVRSDGSVYITFSSLWSDTICSFIKKSLPS